MKGGSDSPRSNTQTAPTRPARDLADELLKGIVAGLAFLGHVDDAGLGMMHVKADDDDATAGDTRFERRPVPTRRAATRQERSALPQMPRVLPRPLNGSTACLRMGLPCMNTNGADCRSCRLTPAERPPGENEVEARTTDDAVGIQTTNAWRTRKNGGTESAGLGLSILAESTPAS